MVNIGEICLKMLGKGDNWLTVKVDNVNGKHRGNRP